MNNKYEHNNGHGQNTYDLKEINTAGGPDYDGERPRRSPVNATNHKMALRNDTLSTSSQEKDNMFRERRSV